MKQNQISCLQYLSTINTHNKTQKTQKLLVLKSTAEIGGQNFGGKGILAGQRINLGAAAYIALHIVKW